MPAKAYIDENGLALPSYPEILESIKDDFKAIYGADTYLEPDSQDGQLCAIFATRIHDCFALAASVYNAYSPHSAQGIGLSSVVKVNGIRRDAATFSQVSLRLIGQAGTIIKKGIVTDEANQRWLLPDEVIIGDSGEINVTALAEKKGDIRAAAKDIKKIATPTRGWQAVINPAPAVPGLPIEEDYKLRQRQAVSTALPSRSIFDGTIGAVAQVKDLSRWVAYENDTSEIDDNGLPPHSICFVVEGGDPQKIGETIALKKGPGCGTYGDVKIETRDQYGVPNIISFFRPDIAQLILEIRINPLAGYLASTGESICKNIFEYINQHNIGHDVLLSKLYTPINEAEPVAGQRSFDILSIKIGLKNSELKEENFKVSFKTAIACAFSDIELKEF